MSAGLWMLTQPLRGAHSLHSSVSYIFLDHILIGRRFFCVEDPVLAKKPRQLTTRRVEPGSIIVRLRGDAGDGSGDCNADALNFAPLRNRSIASERTRWGQRLDSTR